MVNGLISVVHFIHFSFLVQIRYSWQGYVLRIYCLSFTMLILYHHTLFRRPRILSLLLTPMSHSTRQCQISHTYFNPVFFSP